MSESIPEADRIEQDTAAVETDPPAPPEVSDHEVDEADLLDQALPVDVEDEDYPPDPG